MHYLQQLITMGTLLAAASAYTIPPQFFDGSPAALLRARAFTLDLNNSAPTAQELRSRMKATYREHGAVLLTNTGLSQLSQMRPFVQNILEQSMEHYTGGANPRDALEPFFFEVGAPSKAALHYHHEMAYVATSVDALAFSCSAALKGRESNGVRQGSTYLSDNVAATAQLIQTPFGQKLREKGLVY